MKNMTISAKLFISAMAAAGVAALAVGLMQWECKGTVCFLSFLIIALITSRLKVKLPGTNGNMSVNLPFLLTAIVNLSAAEAVAITCVSTVVQCWPRKDAKFKPEQMAFNLSMMAFATTLASLIFHAQWFFRTGWSSNPAGMVLAAATLFVGQTAPVAAIVALSESKAAGPIWWNLAHLSFPYYVLSAGVVSMVQTVGAHMGWELALAVLPVMYGIHRSFRLYFGAKAETPQPEGLVRAVGAGA